MSQTETRPRLLDLFCGAGGAAKGYQDAGFYVVGVDIEDQPNYCGGDFIQADVMDLHVSSDDGWAYVADWLDTFDLIHASPPCQSYSRAMSHLAHPQPELIDETRAMLQQSGVPWVIENVPGAPLATETSLFGEHGTVLCGTSFGLRIRRHRLFESSFPLPRPECDHSEPAMNPANEAGRQRIREEYGDGPDMPEVAWRREMGVEWMSRYEAREAIPPVFTEWIGEQFLAQVAE